MACSQGEKEWCDVGWVVVAGLRIKESKEVYEGEVTELTPEETESEAGGYGKVGLQLATVVAEAVISVCNEVIVTMIRCLWHQWSVAKP